MTLAMNRNIHSLHGLQPNELVDTSGGTLLSIPKWLRGAGAFTVFAYISDNWEEIESEFKKGWNIGKK